MIGVFDSGVGGLNSYRELRRYLPCEDIIYLADRKNAPYGTKDEKTLIKLTKNDIRVLTDMGADKILIACCTASTVYDRLSDAERRISVPIIEPSARLAAKGGRKIAVIATERTAASHAFGEKISALDPRCEVAEIPTQILVELAERGYSDKFMDGFSEKIIDGVADRIRDTRADTLVLGCTHFSCFGDALSSRLPGVAVINPARIGAHALISTYKNEKYRRGKANGRSVYIEA